MQLFHSIRDTPNEQHEVDDLVDLYFRGEISWSTANELFTLEERDIGDAMFFDWEMRSAACLIEDEMPWRKAYD